MIYVEGVMNYTGSKFKMLSQIIPEMDYGKNTFVDTFCGGGSVYINVLDRYEKVIVNDIITDLIGIHRGLLESNEIINNTKLLCPGKGNPVGFGTLRDNYNGNPSPEGLWALMLSCTNNMMRFNQKFKFNQTYGDRGFSDSTQRKVNNFTEHIRKFKDNLVYLSTQFENIDIKSDMMIYLDPPYGRIKNEDGTIGKKQISEAGYNAFWKQEDDMKLYEFIKKIDSIGASFMVSGVLHHDGKTCWMLDKLIVDGFTYKEIKYDYNKVSRKGNKETTEIIITNYVEQN
jgi:adenine-specific DNA-methyltransferase